jgi:aspartate ammonia-lyase
LNPYLGYKTCTKIAKEAHDTGRSVYDIILEQKLMTKDKLDEALDPKNMLNSHKF